jgi:predicted DNA-binding transcriptional regulator AlpA
MLMGWTPAEGRRLLTHDETAAYLRITPASLYSMNQRRTGPRSYKVGNRRMYRVADIDQWLNDHASDIDN